MRIRSYIFLLLLLSTLGAFSQNYPVTGIVSDSVSGNTLPGATIAVYAEADQELAGGVTTSETGKFEIRLENGRYRASVRFLGYREKNISFTVNNQSVDLGLIKISEEARTLRSIEITEQVIQAEQLGDTTQFNAGAFKTNPDANAQDLLEKMPGVTVTDGKVSVQGEQVRQVLIDGKPFMGDDPSAALKNLPAEVIARIQTYDAPSEQAQATGFDDGETRKTINIITKEEFRNGVFGKVLAGYGTDNRYQSGVVLNSFNGDRRINVIAQSNNINQQNFATEDLAGIASTGGRGRGRGRGSQGGDAGDFLVDVRGGITTTHAFGLNYSDQIGKKLELNGSYFFNSTQTTASSSLFRQFTLGETSGNTYSEENNSIENNLNHRINLRAEYKISDRTSLDWRPSIRIQNTMGESTISGKTFRGSEVLSSSESFGMSELNSISLSNNISLRHRFEKAGRAFSARFSNDFQPVSATGSLTARNEFIQDATIRNIDQYSTLTRLNNGYSAFLMYAEPFTEKSQLQFTYRHAVNTGESDRETDHFDEADQDYTIRDTILSSSFSTTFTTRDAGVGIRTNSEKVRLMIRTNFQWAGFESDQRYPFASYTSYDFFSILPMARANIRFTKNKNLNLFYRSGNSAPSAHQLQYVLDNSNPLQLYIGNPHLDPQYQHSFNVRYNSTDTLRNAIFMALLSGSYSHDYIANSTYISTGDTLLPGNILLPAGGQLTTPVNLNGYYQLRAFSTIGFPVQRIKSKLNLNLSAGFSRIPGLVNDRINEVIVPNSEFGVVLSSNISEKIDFTVSSTTGYSMSMNSLNPDANTDYLTQNSRVRLYWNFYRTLVFRSEATHRYISGLASGIDNNFILLNLSVGTRMFKRKNAELYFSVFDLLNQNNSFNRRITEAYIEDTETRILQRYFMLNFTWNFRKYQQPSRVPETPLD